MAQPDTTMQLISQDSRQDDTPESPNWVTAGCAWRPGSNTASSSIVTRTTSPAESTAPAETTGGRGAGEAVPEPSTDTGGNTPIADNDPELPPIIPADPVVPDSEPEPGEPDDDVVIDLPILQVGVDVFPPATILGLAP